MTNETTNTASGRKKWWQWLVAIIIAAAVLVAFAMGFLSRQYQPVPASTVATVPVQTSEQKAVAFATAHFVERWHDVTFFTQEDLETCMLPGISAGLQLTGPEFFDEFRIHQHDGEAIEQVFQDGRANVMAYRCVSTDGQRAYLMIPTLFCSTGCSGADFIFLHAAKARQATIRSPARTPAAQPQPQIDLGTLPTIVCNKCR